MSISTYTLLKAEIANHLDRDNDASIDSFIDLAEARHKREVRIRQMIARASSTVSTRYVALPGDFLEMKTVRLMTSPVTVLSEVSIYEMNRIRVEGSGRPTYYTIHEEIEFNKTPDSSYTLEMIYYHSLDPLTNDNQSNAILERAPDLYLYGALLASAPFLMNDERIQVWSALYSSALEGINSMDKRRAGPLVSRVVGATP
jgi:hypothetical protein